MEFDFSTLSATDAYKLVVSSVVPRPIAWVVTQDEAGRVNAAPFSFFNALSGHPPLLAFGVGARDNGEPKDTTVNIRQTGQFVINMVSEAMVNPMVLTATDFDAGINELRQAGLSTLPSTHIKPPRIAQSPVAFECETFQTITLPGERDLIVGRILSMHIDDDKMLDAARHYVDTPALNLIGRMHGGGWYTRTGDQFEVPRMSVAEAVAKTKA
jgi:flavin reductase (DIM6/NTAB) family NADH-FMN oxidoreductase RutF